MLAAKAPRRLAMSDCEHVHVPSLRAQTRFASVERIPQDDAAAMVHDVASVSLIALRLPIAEIIPCGGFATWRAARVVGDHDLNTFLVRADAVKAAAALQPGMTVSLAPTSRSLR